jgi:hypothetical protein
MLRLFILLLVHSATTAAWVPVVSGFSSSALYVHAARDDEAHYMSRRQVMTVTTAFCILAFVPSASLASEDPLDSFGRQLSGTAGKMPAPQSAVHSAVTPAPATYSGGNASNLQQAIDESLKKKRIDPRTHG